MDNSYLVHCCDCADFMESSLVEECWGKRFFIENYSHVDDDDELYLNYDWSSDSMSIKSNMSNTSQYPDSDGSGERLSLAYEKLSKIPRKIAEKFSKTTTILDLSYNDIKDLSFLSHFRQLNTLILDKNPQPDEKTLPSLPNLSLLWLNHCEIDNVQKWVYRIRDCCPSLRYLSLMGNPGATSSFNGNSTLEHNDYRMMVISILPQLTHLDDAEVTSAQRVQAKQYKHTYNIGQTPFNIFESVGRGQQMSRKASQRRQRKKEQELQHRKENESDS
ncbi:AAEL005312-PE [Aedes aegypti]|uniref:U2-associated snRNP A' protein n=3 Tax=Aedes aegypti TaxID=7159 RepID=Q1HQZ6_AEDAE|nr:U2-associated snRNP A' protein [Aedes aegypti]EJY57579.1 AAEL005312-PE [Aedes aegypti]